MFSSIMSKIGALAGGVVGSAMGRSASAPVQKPAPAKPLYTARTDRGRAYQARMQQVASERSSVPTEKAMADGGEVTREIGRAGGLHGKNMKK